jgi:conflict system STAND superfamily ATPase
LCALVIDQFEELFTAHPERWRDQTGLFDELRTALEQIPRVRMILAIREDFLAQLDPFTALLPGGLRTRFRLERLDRDSALAAVLGPLEGTERSYAPGVADTLVTDLLKFRVDGSPDPVEGQFVEPVQLQVTCRTLWSDLPADVREITSDHLRRHADVDEVLGRFYDDAVRAAARDGRTRERRIRDWVKRALITPGGTRAAAYAGPEETAGLSNRAVQVLDEQRLIRAEWRAGARWYELTHDRLIEPIRRTDERRRRRRRTRVLIASGAAIAVAGVAAGLLFAVSPAESPTSFEPSVSVVVSAVQVTPTRDGMRVAFRVQSRGLGGSALRALVVAERSAGGHIVGTRARVIRAPDSVEVVAFSLPTRRAYVARVGIARASDSALLATASSLPVRAPLPIPTPQPTEVPTATATPG